MNMFPEEVTCLSLLIARYQLKRKPSFLWIISRPAKTSDDISPFALLNSTENPLFFRARASSLSEAARSLLRTDISGSTTGFSRRTSCSEACTNPGSAQSCLSFLTRYTLRKYSPSASRFLICGISTIPVSYNPSEGTSAEPDSTAWPFFTNVHSNENILRSVKLYLFFSAILPDARSSREISTY